MGWAETMLSRWRSLLRHPPAEDRAKMETALEAKEQAERAVEIAKNQQVELSDVARRLSRIRRQNHFEEMFRDALGS